LLAVVGAVQLMAHTVLLEALVAVEVVGRELRLVHMLFLKMEQQVLVVEVAVIVMPLILLLLALLALVVQVVREY
jgi:hypothetical protein